MTNVLSCFFPTTVVLVDDDLMFLDSLLESMKMDNVVFRKFSNPYDALEFINGTCSVNRLDCTDLIRSGEEESTSSWKSTLLNINWLHQKIYSTERFRCISTIIADYSMSDMNGVELCAAVEDKNIQKNLLTGVADEKNAIDAFNVGHIDRFIKKGIEDLGKQVIDGIKKSMYQYFSIFTECLSHHIAANDRTRFKDPVFASFFSNICMSKNYVEYYMLDSFGSYLFMNAKGQTSLLSVLTESEIERIIDIGIESGEIAADVLELLRTREYMLVYHSRDGSLPPIAEWSMYVRPARKLEGYQTYYFSLTDSKPLDIDFNRIKGFEAFQNGEEL
ncbi:MAG: hypothetical protein LBB63_02705 [Holosporaceae bacterium]|nr:hypothetical protein [Holosporaceae bacterium]